MANVSSLLPSLAVATTAMRRWAAAFNRDTPAPRSTLRPIEWGTRDPALARVVLRHMVDANPPIVIPWSPLMRRPIRFLKAWGCETATALDHRVYIGESK